jgi:outer membrane protein assembly factor BamB
MALSLALDAAAADLPKITHDWPCYSGPLGTFADETKTPLLDDFSQAKLVWKSEDKSIGWGKTTTGDRPSSPREPGLYPSGQGSLIVAGGMVIAAYFIPSGQVIHKEFESNPPELRQRGMVMADDVILAVDAATGKTKWKQVFAGKGVNCQSGKRPRYGATPAAAQGKVFHIGTTGRIYCVDLVDGKPLWESFIGTEPPKMIDEQAGKALVQASSKGNGIRFLLNLVVCDQVLLVPSGDTLLGFDIASGKRLWECDGVLSGHNVPSPVKVENQWTLFCVNGKGEMRLMEAKTGKVFWQRALSPGFRYTTQSVAADSKAFVWNPGETVVENGKDRILGKPACYELKLDGAKLLWELPGKYQHAMGGDGGESAKIGYRDGRAYFGTTEYAFVAVNAADGKILGKLAPKTTSFGSFSLWGDKFVMTGDNSHESMGWSCSYTPHTLELAPTGKSYSPRGNQGVSGYIIPMRDPFADGFQFTRTATGQIWCYDLRAQPQ